MKIIAALSFLLLILTESCHTFISQNGAKHRQFLPAKDKMRYSDMDTIRFIKMPFDFTDYSNNIAYNNKKRIFETIRGAEVRTIAKTNVGRYYIYFWNPVCPESAPAIHRLDSLSQKGEHVLVVSLRRHFDAINNKLRKTDFSKYPYYVIETGNNDKILLQRQVEFIKDACPSCYSQYKDDVAAVDMLLVQNGIITPVFYNDTTGINILQ